MIVTQLLFRLFHKNQNQINERATVLQQEQSSSQNSPIPTIILFAFPVRKIKLYSIKVLLILTKVLLQLCSIYLKNDFMTTLFYNINVLIRFLINCME
jgi:hypothetical protein